MALSYPLSFPSAVPIRNITWTAKTIVATSKSPFTGAMQVYEHPGSWWEIDIELPPMERADAEQFIGFLCGLNGPRGTFTLGDPDGTTPRGTATGTPVVKGAGQTGRTLLTDGWSTGVTGILKAGDWIQIGNYAYKVTQDADSDGSGNATLEIFPTLRAAPSDNASITTGSTTSLWRLKTNQINWSVNDLRHYGITIQAVEAI